MLNLNTTTEQPFSASCGFNIWLVTSDLINSWIHRLQRSDLTSQMSAACGFRCQVRCLQPVDSGVDERTSQGLSAFCGFTLWPWQRLVCFPPLQRDPAATVFFVTVPKASLVIVSVRAYTAWKLQRCMFQSSTGHWKVVLPCWSNDCFYIFFDGDTLLFKWTLLLYTTVWFCWERMVERKWERERVRERISGRLRVGNERVKNDIYLCSALESGAVSQRLFWFLFKVTADKGIQFCWLGFLYIYMYIL